MNLITASYIIIAIFIIVFCFNIYRKHNEYKSTEQFVDDSDKIVQSYRSVYLLTKTELKFYQGLIEFLPSSLSVNCKVRLADLVMPIKGIPSWRSAFSKVCSKHIDFVITEKATAKVIWLIELDDLSHNRADRMARDEFVDNLCESTGYIMIHVPTSSQYDFSDIFKNIIH